MNIGLINKALQRKIAFFGNCGLNHEEHESQARKDCLTAHINLLLKTQCLVTLQPNGSRSRQTLDIAPFDAKQGQILANSATIDARRQMAEVLQCLQ